MPLKEWQNLLVPNVSSALMRKLHMQSVAEERPVKVLVVEALERYVAAREASLETPRVVGGYRNEPLPEVDSEPYLNPETMKPFPAEAVPQTISWEPPRDKRFKRR